MVPWMRCFELVQATHGGDDLTSQGLKTSSGGIDVVKAEGWGYVEMDGGKLKPGWLSTIPGSELWMAFDMDLGIHVDPQFISLSVLSSYEHMGQAEVTCVLGCRCDKSQIDGHITNHRHSIPKRHEFRLFQQHHPGSLTGEGGGSRGGGNSSSNSTYSSRCVIQLKVLQASRSGEHKVKVMQLAIKKMVNASALLPHANT